MHRKREFDARGSICWNAGQLVAVGKFLNIDRSRPRDRWRTALVGQLQVLRLRRSRDGFVTDKGLVNPPIQV